MRTRPPRPCAYVRIPAMVRSAYMRKPYNMSIDSDVMDRLGESAPEVNRSRLVEKLLVRWLAERDAEMSPEVAAAASDSPVGAGIIARALATPTASARVRRGAGYYYCPTPACIWNTTEKGEPCPKHAVAMTREG